MSNYPHWLLNLLGDSAADIVDLFPGCINAAHHRARDAQDVSLLRQKNPYGSTSWLAVYAEFVDQIGSLPGASLHRPHRASYRLVVINGTLIYPYRQGSAVTQDLKEGRMKVTPLRRAITSLGQRSEVQHALDFTQLMSDGDEDWLDPELTSPQGIARRVLMLPFISNSDAGLLAAGVGEGTLLHDGHIDWEHFHQLDLDLYRAAPQAVVEEAFEPRFDNGSLPEPPLARRAHEIDNPEESDEQPLAEADSGTND